MRHIELSPRLRSVAELVPRGAVLADVGTDHAFLPVYLLQRGLIERAVATDIRMGPLSKAKANAEKYGLTERMVFRLCDGLSQVGPEEADSIAIAGMGGETIAAILRAAPWTARDGYTLLLQPMTSLYDLRGFLSENGYTITKEHLNREGRRIYVTMEVSGGRCAPYSEGEKWAGRQWRGMSSPLRKEFLEDMLNRAKRALSGLEQSVRPGDIPRRDLLREIVPQVEKMREEWSEWQQ